MYIYILVNPVAIGKHAFQMLSHAAQKLCWLRIRWYIVLFLFWVKMFLKSLVHAYNAGTCYQKWPSKAYKVLACFQIVLNMFLLVTKLSTCLSTKCPLKAPQTFTQGTHIISNYSQPGMTHCMNPQKNLLLDCFQLTSHHCGSFFCTPIIVRSYPCTYWDGPNPERKFKQLCLGQHAEKTPSLQQLEIKRPAWHDVVIACHDLVFAWHDLLIALQFYLHHGITTKGQSYGKTWMETEMKMEIGGRCG